MGAAVKGLDESRVREAIAAAIERQADMTPLSQAKYESVRELKLETLRRSSDKVIAAVAGCEGVSHWILGDGYVDVDFTSIHQEIICPAVFIAIGT